MMDTCYLCPSPQIVFFSEHMKVHVGLFSFIFT
jgi:hypothetical protein